MLFILSSFISAKRQKQENVQEEVEVEVPEVEKTGGGTKITFSADVHRSQEQGNCNSYREGGEESNT